MIVHDTRNPRAREMREALDRRLPDGFSDPDIVVVLGGDGFLLQTVGAHGWGRTYLGLNAGHLGFLLNDVDDWDAIARRLAERDFTVRRFPLLEAEIEREDGSVVTDRALNDVYLERMTGQTARLRLSIDGHCAVEKLVADGVIFSTALGSTAYAYSAGGLVCHPTLRVITVTPICPHLPKLPPIALPESACAVVEVLHGEHRPVRAVADGREVNAVRRVTVRTSATEASLAYFPENDFTATLIRKLLRR
jgi:NAD+ kinase